jgi:aspartate carbamoyltransferase catalytic subunit
LIANLKVLGKAKVVSFEDLERARVKCVVKDAKKTEKEVQKAAKEAKNVASART